MAIFTEFYKYLLCLKIILISNVAAITEPDSQVEVRAVFLNCEPDERQTLSLDNEVSRFQREELYKHSALRDCNKKIAVTVKIASEPSMNSADEFIPIEHVFQGSRRVRLLDPYLMRLRRELPLQAYKLKKLDTVSGILQYTEDSNKRPERSSDISTSAPHMVYSNSSYSSLNNLEHGTGTTQNQIVKNYDTTHVPTVKENIVKEPADFPQTYSSISDTTKCSNKRNKRNELNIMIENEPKIPEIFTEKSKLFTENQRKEVSGLDELTNPYTEKDDRFERNTSMYNMDSDTYVRPGTQVSLIPDPSRFPDLSTKSNEGDEFRIDKTKPRNVQKSDWQIDEQEDESTNKNLRNPKSEKQLIVYEIANPDIWSTIHVQLFEKLSTPEGKTVWNNLSKGDPATVSSLFPEWSDQDLNVRYRATWLPRENFSLTTTHMCLVTPQDKYDNKDAVERDSVKYGDYIVVPREDIVTLDSSKTVEKRHFENNSDDQQPANQFRRVMVRMSRALVDNKADKMNVQAHKGDQYLTMPYGGTHQGQIDIEARADDNQLLNVGSSGRIMTIVSDNTRRTRTILNVQIMNTGLTAARFSIKSRDCGPELQSSDDESGPDNDKDDSMLLPPRHTRHERLVVPDEVPSESTRCSVSLVGEGGNSIAVRDVTIKRGDRCYCVWHCECVCLSDDPKLICEEMPDSRQLAAGLSLRERPRHVRSVCYHDVPSVNVIVTFFGVLIVLFVLGFIKAVLGLIFSKVGSWGIARIVEMPRQISRYYESSIHSIPVEYDDEGWPIHPITKTRNVRLLSRSMEFLLNIVFFFVYPCRLVYDILKQIFKFIIKPITRKCSRVQRRDSMRYESDVPSQDLQKSSRLRRRRRRQITRLRRWMTHEADDLSNYLWQKGLQVDQISNNTSMRPLICEENGQNYKKPQNSDEDDTEFVLAQMKKSRESLAKSQKTQNGAGGGKQQQPLRRNSK